MGEIAEMMLDGTLCEVCGEFIGEPCGYPRKCKGCGGKDIEEYDFDFNLNGINLLSKEIIEQGTPRQKKQLRKTFNSLVEKMNEQKVRKCQE